MAERPIIIPASPSLTQLRRAFNIPENVTILAGATLSSAISKNTVKQKSEKFDIDSTDLRDNPLAYKSSLNTFIYTNIEFLPGSYETQTKGVFKNFGSDQDGSPDKLRYEAVLINVTQAKKIIKTEIQGRDGTVKEYIGMDDFAVTVNGIITGANGQRPLDQIAGLNKMLVAPVPIEVACTYLQNLGIHFLVVESWELGEQVGSYSYQPFSISFISDVQQELILTEF